MSKAKRFITCPFCKRNTEVEAAHRFKYGLTANSAYAQLRTKYLQLLDRLNCSSSQNKLNREEEPVDRFELDYCSSLAELDEMVRSLKDRLKQS